MNWNKNKQQITVFEHTVIDAVLNNLRAWQCESWFIYSPLLHCSIVIPNTTTKHTNDINHYVDIFLCRSIFVFIIIKNEIQVVYWWPRDVRCTMSLEYQLMRLTFLSFILHFQIFSAFTATVASESSWSTSGPKKLIFEHLQHFQRKTLQIAPESTFSSIFSSRPEFSRIRGDTS